MSYLDDVKKDLMPILERLGIGNEPDELIDFINKKLVESFKNGAQAARRRSQNRNKQVKVKD